jgi:hypothetical protein
MTYNTLGLLALTTVTSNTETEAFPQLSDAFKTAAAERKAAAERDAVEAIKTLMDGEAIRKEALRGEIRRLRVLEGAAKNKLLEIDIAKAYAAATNNFIPWCLALNRITCCHDVGLSHEDWERVKSVPDSFRTEFFAAIKAAKTTASS